MAKSYFQTNPFWRNAEKTEAMTIYCTDLGGGKVDREQRVVSKFQEDGTIDPLWTQLIAEVGEGQIDTNTDHRRKSKKREENANKLRNEQREKSVELERLFELKLKAFEVKEVRECKDRRIRTKVRAAKNETEMNGWIAVAFMKSLEESDE